MHNQAILLAAALGLKVAYADFVLVTEAIPQLPEPTQTITDEQQALSYFASLYAEANKLATKYSSIFDQQSAIESQLDAFAATATTLGIPAEATDESITTYTEVPPWFTALPQEIQDYKKAEASAGLALASDLINVVTGGASSDATLTVTVANSTETGYSNSTTTSTESSTESSAQSTTLATSAAAGNETLKIDPSPSPSQTKEVQTEPSNAASSRTVGVGAALMAVAGAAFAFL